MNIDISDINKNTLKFMEILGEDNTHTKTWCSDNIDYRIEHVIHNCLDLYPQPLHG